MATEVAAATEEPAKQVEGIVVVPAAALLPLLEPLVAILVVDLAGLRIDQGLVGFGDPNELFLSSVIATVGEQGSVGL